MQEMLPLIVIVLSPMQHHSILYMKVATVLAVLFR